MQDWWNDFDLPMQSYQKTFNRQISETPRRSMLDSFFDLKMGRQGRDSFLTSGTSHSSSMKLKEGVYTIGNYLRNFLIKKAKKKSRKKDLIFFFIFFFFHFYRGWHSRFRPWGFRHLRGRKLSNYQRRKRSQKRQ